MTSRLFSVRYNSLNLTLILQMSTFHYSNLRVKFEGEEGSGPGVNRGFFAAVANALKTDEKVEYTMIILLRLYLRGN